MKSFIKSAICFPFGYIIGQKYEDGQTFKASFVLQSFKWRNTEPILDIGGQSQFKAMLQSSVNDVRVMSQGNQTLSWNILVFDLSCLQTYRQLMLNFEQKLNYQ